MSNFAKKILVAAFAAVVVAAVAVPPPAQAQTTAELQAQIASLLAQIQALQAQLGTSGGGGVSGIPAGFQFNSNLTVGSTGTDVMYLQMALNAYNNSSIAASGAGSPGNETSYFGPVTAGGVTAFQNKYASEVLTPVGLTSGTGFFGPSTRTKMNSLLASAPAPSPTPGTPSPTPGTPSPTPGISTPGAEGSLIVTINSTPASGAILDTGETEDVTAIDVKATGSDVLVNRLDLQFDTRPWQYISEMTVSDGTTSNTVTITEADTTEVTVGSTYSYRVSGLNILVPKDTTKKLTVSVKAASGLPVGTTTKNIVLTFIANSVRGTDGAGLTQTAPTASIATRTITVQEPSTADLELTAHADNPKARNVLVNTAAKTEDIELAKFDLKAKNNSAILRTLEVTHSAAASGTLDVLYLYDGSTLLSSSGSIDATTTVFGTINLEIPKDTSKTLVVKAKVKKTTGNYEQGGSSTVVIDADTTAIDAEDSTSFAATTVSGSAVSPGTAYFYSKMPKITLASTSIVGIEGTSGSLSPQAADATIRINVQALGGDIYVASSSDTFGSSGLSATTSQAASLTVSQTFGTDAEDNTANGGGWLVRAGETKWFEYNVNMNTTAAADSDVGYFAHVKPVHIIWDTDTDTNTWIGAMPQTWVVDQFRTSDIFLQGAI